jgi:hypothetical protein
VHIHCTTMNQYIIESMQSQSEKITKINVDNQRQTVL